MERAPSSLRLLAKDWVATGLAVTAGALWLVLFVAFALFRKPGGEDPLLLRIFGGMAVLLTAVWAAWVLRRWLFIRRLLARGVTVRGRVLRVESNSEHVWAMVLGYTFEGREYQTRSVTGVEPPYRVADTVPLRVDPVQPSRAMIFEEKPGGA